MIHEGGDRGSLGWSVFVSHSTASVRTDEELKKDAVQIKNFAAKTRHSTEKSHLDRLIEPSVARVVPRASTVKALQMRDVFLASWR